MSQIVAATLESVGLVSPVTIFHILELCSERGRRRMNFISVTCMTSSTFDISSCSRRAPLPHRPYSLSFPKDCGGGEDEL